MYNSLTKSIVKTSKRTLLACALAVASNFAFVQLAHAQYDSLINNPTPSPGFLSSPIEFNGTLYYRYDNGSGIYQLAKYAGDGSNVDLVTNPDPGHGYIGNPIVFKNNLYFRYQIDIGNYKLAKFDGTTITLLNNPSLEKGVSAAKPIIYNNILYMNYKDGANKWVLAKYPGTGSTISRITNVDGNPGVDDSASLVVYGANLYFGYNTGTAYRLAKFNGTVESLIANPDAGLGFKGQPIVYNSNLYFAYQTTGLVSKLAKFNGSAISLFANPDAGKGFKGFPVIFGTNLYFQYQNAGLKLQLAKFNGSTVSLITNPDAGRGNVGNPIVFNGNLFIKYELAVSSHWEFAKFDGTTLSLVNNPDGGLGKGINTMPILFNNNLYLGFINAAGKNQLSKFDGSTIKFITNPDAGAGFMDSQVVFKSNLYFIYKNAAAKQQLAKLVMPCNQFISQTTTGDIVFTVTLTGKQAHVEVFYTKNGADQHTADILASEVNNGDGTYTYSYTQAGAYYATNDVILARFYSYLPASAGVFTPGPSEGVWSSPLTYNVSCGTIIVPPTTGCDFPSINGLDMKILVNGDVFYSLTVANKQAYVELFARKGASIFLATSNIVNSEVLNGDGTYTYSYTIPAANFTAGNVLDYRFYYYPAAQGGIFNPGPTQFDYTGAVTYGPCVAAPALKSLEKSKLEIKQIDNVVVFENANESNLLVQVYTLNGQLVLTTNTKSVSLDQFASGMYLIAVTSNGERTTSKVIVK